MWLVFLFSLYRVYHIIIFMCTAFLVPILQGQRKPLYSILGIVLFLERYAHSLPLELQSSQSKIYFQQCD